MEHAGRVKFARSVAQELQGRTDRHTVMPKLMRWQAGQAKGTHAALRQEACCRLSNRLQEQEQVLTEQVLGFLLWCCHRRADRSSISKSPCRGLCTHRSIVKEGLPVQKGLGNDAAS